MAAKDMAKAQESAWDALRSAKLKRDRRYALTVLAEAYRSEEKLDQLIARFAATPDLSDEARMTWIDLLREQGDADKALALFQQAEGRWRRWPSPRTCAARCSRSAARRDATICWSENFREMIASEPRRLEWRSGLCRFYLERGERDKGAGGVGRLPGAGAARRLAGRRRRRPWNWDSTNSPNRLPKN